MKNKYPASELTDIGKSNLSDLHTNNKPNR